MNRVLVRCDTHDHSEGKGSSTLLKYSDEKFTNCNTLNYIELTKEKLERL